MEDSEVDFIINEFLGNLGSVEDEVVPAKSRRIRHVHWWDGWENKPETEPEDLKALKYELVAILECTGTDKKVVLEELRKRTREDKTGESVRCLALAYYKMASLISGSDLKDTNNFASRVHRMLQLEYFEEHAKFPLEEDGSGNKKFHLEEGDNTKEVEKKSQEDFRCLAAVDLRSTEIMELKEAGESLGLRAVHDPEAFGMSENNDSDDLLLQIAAVEAEWNSLIVNFSVQENKWEDKKFSMQEDGGVENSPMTVHMPMQLHSAAIHASDKGINSEFVKGCNSSHVFMGKLGHVKIGEDIFDSDLTWKRLVRSVLEQSLATLRSSQGLIIL